MTQAPSLFRLARRSVILWVGIPFFAIGSIFLSFGTQDLFQEHRFQREGITAQATVLSKSLVRAKRGEHARTQYLLTYRFTTAAREVIENTNEVPVEEWERLDEGNAYQVTYLPDSPHASRGIDQADWNLAIVFTLLGTIFALVGGTMSFVSLRHISLALRILREGMIAEGTVLAVQATGTTINRVRQWELRYQYRDHLGQTHEGVSELLSPDEASAWHKGATGTVRFDRLRPQDSAWVGKA